jgi:hypothetical protein
MGKAQSLIVALVLGISSLTMGQSSYAGNGGAPEPPVPPIDFDVPANSIKPGACAFDVHVVSESGKAKTITLSDNRFIFTSPGLSLTLTNLSDPTKSVTLSVTGAFHQSQQNGNVVTVATGRNLLGDPDAGFVLAIGTFSFVFDTSVPPNLVQPLMGRGQLINVCDLIS